MSRLARLGEALAVVATVSLAVVALTAATPDRRLLGGLFATAILWSAAPLLGHLLAGRRSASVLLPTAAQVDGVATGSFTTIVRFGQEPLDIARTTILLATSAGPTIVVGLEGTVPAELRDLGADVVEAVTFGAGLALALPTVGTDAVLIVSARSVPIAAACNEAAALLSPDLGWVVGRARPFTAEGYVVDSREPVTANLRAAARRAGTVLWEPDVTLVRTDLLLEHPVEDRRPMGRWLRARHAEGVCGGDVAVDLVRRAAPVDSTAYWPDAVSRQWGRVADLTGALGRGPIRARLAAAGLLARELFAVPALVWAALPILAGSEARLPYARSYTACLALVVGVGVLRYLAAHVAVDRPPRPVHDAVAALHSAPGSLAAIGAVVTRRLPTRRMHLPSRPLVWAALVLTAATGYRLVDSTGTQASAFSIGLSLGALGLLWMFSMGALAQKNWGRSTYRVPLTLDVHVGGDVCRTLNASPSGLALTGVDTFERPVGTVLPVEMTLDDGTSIDSTAEVTALRHVGSAQVIGLSLDFADDARRRWIDQLARAADATHGRVRPTRRRDPEAALDNVEPAAAGRGVGDRLVIGLVGTVSIAIGALLLLVMLGYRPLVIRSGSMVPTLDIGDVVLSEEVPVSALRPGDVANLPTTNSDGTGTLTHRVVSVEADAGEIVVVTQGDANSSSESNRLLAGTPAGRARWTIPWIGRPATAVRTSTAQMWIGLGVLGLVILAVTVRPRRRAAAGATSPT